MQPNIIGYIHICQDGKWDQSLTLILDSLYSSGLYEQCREIICGIVYPPTRTIDRTHPLLQDEKFTLVDLGDSAQYERPTLLHLRHRADSDPSNTLYWYAHTKGLRHFGTRKEENVLDWIQYMLYWNIKRWDLAVELLSVHDYDTYGCDLITNQHYSGNFWWCRVSHLQKLPQSIPDYYTAPEDYICRIIGKFYNVFSSKKEGGRLYFTRFPPDKYTHLDHLTPQDPYWTQSPWPSLPPPSASSSLFQSFSEETHQQLYDIKPLVSKPIFTPSPLQSRPLVPPRMIRRSMR